MNAKVEIKSAKDLTPAEALEYEALRKKIFPPAENDWVWAKADWVILLRVDQVLVSILEIFERTVKVKDESILVGGIGGVGTDPAWRGRGLASQAMCSAIDFIHSKVEADFGLLICDRQRISFYTVLGWEVINDAVFFEQPSGIMKNDAISMVYTLTRRSWPKGDVDYCGLPW